MGAKVIIFGQSLMSQFLKGLTHSAMSTNQHTHVVLGQDYLLGQDNHGKGGQSMFKG